MNAWIRKLEAFGPISDDDKALILKLTKAPKSAPARSDIISEGEKPSDVNLILEGFAYRYKTMPTGTRQIVAYLLPGDFCDLHIYLLGEMDHSIGALTTVRYVQLSQSNIDDLLSRPTISRAMLTATLIDEAVMREWLTNNGQRSAEMRIAHFLCEWHRRLRAIDRANPKSCELPITQAELAETMGLSAVHVNRSLQSLREKGLITINRKRLALPDIDALSKACGFNAKYLHLMKS